MVKFTDILEKDIHELKDLAIETQEVLRVVRFNRFTKETKNNREQRKTRRYLAQLRTAIQLKKKEG